MPHLPKETASDFSDGCIGIMENEMETTIMGYMGIIGYILGFRAWGLGLIFAFLFPPLGFRLQGLRQVQGSGLQK